MEQDRDEDLIKRFIAGDEGAFTSLYESRQKHVLGIVLRKLKDHGEAEECTSAIFSNIYFLFKKPGAQCPENFAAWLHSVAVHMAYRHTQKPVSAKIESIDYMDEKKMSEKIVDFSPLEALIESENIEERQRMVQKLLLFIKKLSQKQQRCLHLFYYKEMSYNEIAASEQLSWTEVSSAIQNGKRRLREMFEQRLH